MYIFFKLNFPFEIVAEFVSNNMNNMKTLSKRLA